MTVLTLAAGTGRDRSDIGPAWLQPLSLPDLDVGEYRLKPLGDGLLYQDRTFTARMARDGVVTFQDRRVFFDRVGLLPHPMPGALDWPTLESLLFARPRSEPRSLSVPEQGPFPGSPADPIDMSVPCPQPSTCYALPGLLAVTGVGVGADVTNEFLRALGQDPYRMQKARFLAATFDMRIGLAVQAHQDDLQTSLKDLPEGLAELWHDVRYSPHERRRILFELWREADQGDAGAQAREVIMTFIRRVLPCKSPEAYPSTELQVLQSRDTGPSFSPYGACGR